MRKWRVEDSAELYNINGWGRQYFSINEKGNVTVTPRPGLAPVDLREVLDELQVKDITAPLLLRFPDILDNRVEKISSCFHQASEQYGYQSNYYIVYPIKVNQMRIRAIRLSKQLLYRLPHQGQPDAARGGGDCEPRQKVQHRP